jgi:hypothetical protein
MNDGASEDPRMCSVGHKLTQGESQKSPGLQGEQEPLSPN